MSLLRRLFERPELEERDLTFGLQDLIVRDRLGPYSAFAGVPVSYVNALTHDAVFACVNKIVNTVSTLPVATFRKKGRVRERVANQPIVVTSPSGILEREEWVGQIVMSILEKGNAYGVVVDRDAGGFATQVELRDHRDVKVTRVGKTGPPIYRIDNKVIENADVFHVRGLTRPGSVVGISTIDVAKETIARGLAAERYGSQWFSQGAHPSSILKAGTQVNEDQAKIMKQRFVQSVNGREPVVLGSGVEYQEIQADPSKSQLVEVERLITEKTARFFDMPVEMIGGSSSGSSVTYANREQRAIDFVTFTIRPWLIRIENPWSKLTPRGQFVRFIVDALLRADTKTRYDSHAVAVRTGWRSVNEIRELEDEEPIDDGDQYLWPPFTSSPGTNQGNDNA